MRTDAQRKDKYVAKTTPTTVGLKVASVLGDMKSGFSAAISDLYPIETKIQGILNSAGTVPTLRYPFYLNFGRELWKRDWAGIDGPALVAMAVVLTAKYVDYGLVEAHLIKIALDCFGITVPPVV